MISKATSRYRWPLWLMRVVSAWPAGSTFTFSTMLMPMRREPSERASPDRCLPSHDQLAARRRCRQPHLSAWTETGNWTG